MKSWAYCLIALVIFSGLVGCVNKPPANLGFPAKEMASVEKNPQLEKKPLVTQSHSVPLPPIGCLDITSDGKTAVSGGDEGSLFLWNLQTTLETQPIALQGHQNSILVVKFSRDGKRLVSADSNGIIKVWDVGARKHLTTFTTTGAQPSRQSVADLDATGSLTSTSLNFANNDAQVLVATKDGFLRTFSITGELLRKQFFGFGDSWVVLHLSPDGETVVAGGEVELKVFNRSSGRPKYRKIETCGGINHIAFSKNGTGFVACCGGFPDQPKSGMTLYQTDSGVIQRRFGENSVPVRCADFFPDGQMIVSADYSLRQNEGALRLWDCASSQSVGMVKADEKAVQAVKVTPDGKRILSGGLDGRIRCWELKD